MALRLENKNALITGGASGIGRATAIRFAEEGANVFVADRHLAAAEETAASVQKTRAQGGRVPGRYQRRGAGECDGRADGEGSRRRQHRASPRPESRTRTTARKASPTSRFSATNPSPTGARS